MRSAADRLSLLRTFGKPGYSPAQGSVRIYNNRFYAVTMQNVERDSRTDYVGLAEGEYVEILPGQTARRRREASLNHCNAIAEYTGRVYMVRCGSFGHELKEGKLVSSVEKANRLVTEHEKESDEYIDRCRKAAYDYRARATKEAIVERAKKTSIGIAGIDDPTFIEEEIRLLHTWANESDNAANTEENNPSFHATIEDVTEKAEYAAEFVRY